MAVNAASSLAAFPKAVKPDGPVSLTVEDEELEGDKAYLVIIAQNGALLGQLETVIGGN